ncbi:MAG: type II toxin-antitoxin system VapB family antitoxin [Phycisphaerales bacterium]|nr:type II toxin-antitoxin system VapB family antitoxin [Phycisphaerales bacterium]
MRTTMNIDDKLLAKAAAYTGISSKTELVHEALRALIAREAGKRLLALGGTDPKAKAAPRKRPAA